MMTPARSADPRSAWTAVRFTKRHHVAWGSLISGVYAAGEVAGFPPEIAARIVDSGNAVYIDGAAPPGRYQAK